MSEYEKIEKKVKRSTINDALIAANLGEYTTAKAQQSNENNNTPSRIFSMPDNRNNTYQNYYPMSMMQQNYGTPMNNMNMSLNMGNNNINPQNSESVAQNNLYTIFQRAANDKTYSNFNPPTENNTDLTQQNANPESNITNQGKKKTRWGPSNPSNNQIGTKINNLTLNINNNTNININPYQSGNNNGLQPGTIMPSQISQMKHNFNPGFSNPNLLTPYGNKNMMNMPIFSPIQNKQVGIKFSTVNNSNLMFNSQINAPNRLQNTGFPQRFGQLNSNNFVGNQISINSNEDRIRLIMEGIQTPPDSLRDYITRAYQKCLSLSEKNQMDKFLKKIINLSKIHNDTHSKDWKSHPLPTLPRERLEFNKEMNATANVFSIEEGSSKNTIIDPNEAITILNNSEKSYVKGKIVNRINRPLANKNITTKIGRNLKIIQKIKKGNMTNPSQGQINEVSQEEEDKRNQRKARFYKELSAPANPLSKKSFAGGATAIQDEEDFDFEILCEKWKIKGTCTDLEKSYLRLTSEPDPSQVRPEKVLKNSMKMLLGKWKEGVVKYNYISEQFRSIRQDLIIQHIRNDFTVKVYENNARICLECHDINQFNQCQGKLYELYKDGIKGNKYEFLCYRMIYLILNNQKYEINRLLNELSDEDLKQTNILISLELQTSMEIGNVKKVFEFYKSAPNLSQYLIDLFINKLRIWGLQILTKALGEKISINYLTNLLAFNDPLHCVNFLEETQAVISEDQNWLMARESHKILSEHPIMKEYSYKAKK